MKRQSIQSIWWKMLLAGFILLAHSCRDFNHNPQIKIWCVAGDSIVYARIENIGDTCYYYPENYLVQYNNDSDTAYFESISKKQYAYDHFYYYNKEFSDPIMTTEPLTGIKPDSSKTLNYGIMYYQFSPPRLLKLRPKQIIKLKFNIKLSRPLSYSNFKIYKTLYEADSSKDFNKYHSYEQFVKYETNESFDIKTKIVRQAQY